MGELKQNTSEEDGPRVAPIEPGTDKGLAEVEEQIKGTRGDITLLYRVLLNSAPIAKGWEQLLTAVRYRSTLPGALRELAILRVAVLNHASYEFEAHRGPAEKAGVSSRKIDALLAQPTGPLFNELELLVLACTDAMTRQIDVPDALFEQLRQHFNAREIVELIVTIAAYNMVSRFLVAMNIVGGQH